MSIKNVSIIGAGTMGNGIAQVFAQGGYNVILCDISQDSLDRALKTIENNLERMTKKEVIDSNTATQAMKRITLSTNVANGVASADLIIEAATENIDLKLKIFKELDEHAPDHCILATNTSSISITQLASVTQRPDKVIGMHFMNPVPIMKLVEVISGYNTTEKTISTIIECCKSLQKIPVEVNDYPGFVANRILMPMINEAAYTLYEGVSGVEEIDNVMKLGMAHPMGPLALADFIGIDVCVAILQIMHKGFGNPKYAPCPLLVNMVTAGNIGRKSGMGFYTYTLGNKEFSVAKKFNKR